MSALPAQITELSSEPAAVRPAPGSGARLRAERRAEMASARRLRQRWAMFSVAVLGCFFGLTVGVLDVLH
jgi:hypothetical protein